MSRRRFYMSREGSKSHTGLSSYIRDTDFITALIKPSRISMPYRVHGKRTLTQTDSPRQKMMTSQYVDDDVTGTSTTTVADKTSTVSIQRCRFSRRMYEKSSSSVSYVTLSVPESCDLRRCVRRSALSRPCSCQASADLRGSLLCSVVADVSAH